MTNARVWALPSLFGPSSSSHRSLQYQKREKERRVRQLVLLANATGCEIVQKIRLRSKDNINSPELRISLATRSSSASFSGLIGIS